MIDRWQLLSDWHNAWLAADSHTRARLRADFALAHPELAAEADALASTSSGLAGFLETSALTIVAADLAHDDPVFAVNGLVGPYRIVGLLGRGGMGDVYRATDTRLRRDVALKVLTNDGTDDPQRVDRFIQEARITASLDHAHIVKVFDVGVIDERPYLVAEWLDGETLRGRLERRAITADEARRIGGEIAAGLVVAHAAGLVHRDLKPENVFLTRAGVTKILDFGIAKLTADAPSAADGVATMTGIALGTPGYIAPEQIRGGAVDGRTDLFALGSMLFEMTTGQRAFAREHTVDALHAILHEPPPDPLPTTGGSPALTAIVMRLLEKDPSRRFQSAADLEWALAHLALAADGPWPTATPTHLSSDASPHRNARRGRFAVAVAAAVAVTALGWLAYAMRARTVVPPARQTVVRFAVPPPAGNRLPNDVERTHLAFSPDGSQLAFIARGVADGVSRIWLRPIADADARLLGGTDGARSFFWSPDGRSLAFFANDKLMRLDLPDGAAVRLCDTPGGVGRIGTWGADGEILFASVEGNAIYGVSTRDGVPAPLLSPDQSRGEVRINWPWFLPDGRRFLYWVRLGEGGGQVMLGERGRPSRAILSAASNAQWVDPDIVVFVKDGILVGQRVDLAAARPVGEPFSIAEPISYFYSTGRGEFATSRTGNVAYQAHSDVTRLAWTDRHGTKGEDVGAPAFYLSLSLAPDGSRLAFSRNRVGLGTPDLWSLDLVRGGETRLTSDEGSEAYPTWERGGIDVLYMADRGGPPHLFRKNLVTGADQMLLPPGRLQQPDDITPDGRTLAFEQRTPRGNYDIMTLSLDTPGAPAVLLGSPFDEIGLRFSPDGHAAAFDSDESGRYEVYVAPFPAMSPHLLVSVGGGRAPRWNPVGRELIYLSNDGGVVSVPVRTTPSVELGASTTLFRVPERQAWTDFVMSPDGKRFLSIVPESRGDEQSLTVILDWPSGIARR